MLIAQTLKNEGVRKSETRRTTSQTEKLLEQINTSNEIHRITHPECYSCGSLMILLHDGKFCPECGRLVIASEGWKRDHPKYYGVGQG